MTWQPHGQHLIAGERVGGTEQFLSAPATGPAQAFARGTVEMVDRAACAADAAFPVFSATSRAARADLLDRIAAEIEARADAVTDIGSRETGLPEARLQGERGRTTGQLRLFAEHIRKGDYLDRRHDAALPDRHPLPRPDLRLMQRPIGPVAVFGASNFPLAFSVAGGDTASALAAGCPVVVKGHSAHPGTSEIVGDAIAAALDACGMPAGAFSLVQGGDRHVGAALVQHRAIKAVGFTGSLAGGRALFDLCAARPDPIPFFGELGAVNPVFLLPAAMQARAAAIAEGWAASLVMGAGQFCTNPGLAIALAGPQTEALLARMQEVLAQTGAQVMLTEGIAAAYRQGAARVASAANVRAAFATECPGRSAQPNLFVTDARTFLADHMLAEEVFGPLGLLVIAADGAEMLEVARALPGQLTATLHLEPQDLPLARQLLPLLEGMAGRVLVNGFPTGVEVADSMVHGGPYPASTNFGATSVGTMAIRRWLRPVCYQNFPADLLPADLRD